MGDEADVRLVDAHAERDRGDDDDSLLPQEPRLRVLAHCGVETRVVGHGVDPAGAEPRGSGLHALAGHAVDDARLPRVLRLDEPQQLVLRAVLGLDPVLDVGAVEVGDEVPRVLHAQPLGDLLVGGPRGGRGECDAGNVREGVRKHGQPHVVGAEVMPPLGDAVRLVDREQGDRCALQQLNGARQGEPFGGHVEQVNVPGEKLPLHLLRLVGLQGGVEVRGADAHGLERGHLVRHERDQRGDHHARAVPQQCGDLVAQGLAAAGGHEHDCVPAGHHLLDDLRLLTAEGVVPENLL